MNKDFENIVTKLLKMAHKVAHKVVQMTKIEIAQNYLKIGGKPISSVLNMNIDDNFENIVTKVVQMTQNLAQMT